MFVVIEGLDGAGTTTQAALLTDRLRAEGHAVTCTREPSDGPVGVLIRQMLGRRVVCRDGSSVGRETLALLFAADRLDHIANEIEPALAGGSWVISDRYYHSSFAYQGDVDDSDHFDFDWVRALNGRARVPDVTIYLDAPPDVCLGRIADRGHRDIYETREKLERLSRRYAEINAALIAAGERVVSIDGTGSVDAIHASIVELVLDGQSTAR